MVHFDSSFHLDEHIELNMEPRELRFEKRGGLLKVQLHNPTDTRQAIKVKCSDNNLYRVNPVYGFIEPGAQLNVYVGPPRVLFRASILGYAPERQRQVG